MHFFSQTFFSQGSRAFSLLKGSYFPPDLSDVNPSPQNPYNPPSDPFQENCKAFQVQGGSQEVSRGVGIFLINLDHSRGRLDYVMPQLQALGYPLERISGINGRFLPWPFPEVDEATHQLFFSKSIGQGTVGCGLSHIKAWQHFLSSPSQFGLICEDDLSFEPSHLRKIIHHLMSDPHLWDICAFQLNHQGMPLPLKSYEGDKLSLYLTPVTGAGCYLINRAAACKLLSKAFPLKLPIDHYYTRAWELDLRFTGIEPRPVVQGHGSSEIHSLHRDSRLPLSFPQRLIRALWIAGKSLMTFFYGLKLWLQKGRKSKRA